MYTRCSGTIAAPDGSPVLARHPYPARRGAAALTDTRIRVSTRALTRVSTREERAVADEQVLRAQKWVNSTYRSVAGYVACPEDGHSGWGTVYSLIMGLQHELGISPVVASLGPGTYSKLDALGDIGFQWDKNRNIVAILQYGLWCKG